MPLPIRTSPARHARVAAALLVGTLLALPVAGCGGSDASTPAAGAAGTTPGEPTPETSREGPSAPEGGTVSTTPETAAEGAGTVSSGRAPKADGDFSAPKDADAPGAPRQAAPKGLRVESKPGAKPRWIVTAKSGSDDQFCASLSIPGPFDPDPQCETGELLALEFFGDDATGPAVGTVVQAPLTRREGPSQLVVAGLASGDVKKVRVRYGQKTYTAKLSSDVVDLPVDQRMARELSGATREQVARLPDPVTVRAFGVSFPRASGNPPRVVTPETTRSVDGVITLQLS